MKKRILLSSIIAVLLVLISIQIAFLNSVKSNPMLHSGDANVGELWVTELDVSSVLQTIDNIGIAHVRANDDWVIWTQGVGDVKATWSAEIGPNHPEYYAIFTLVVYNTYELSKPIGTDSDIRTYSMNESYDTGGVLSVHVNLSEPSHLEASKILVCHLGVIIKLNETTEAVNFSSKAEDRGVVAVENSFLPKRTFQEYLEESNDEIPSQCSWINGWDEERRFRSEGDMLNTQTFFKVGSDNTSQNNYNEPWWLGNITAERFLIHCIVRFQCGDTEINWTNASGSDWVYGQSYMNYDMRDERPGWQPGVNMRYNLWYENFEPATFPAAYYRWRDGADPTGSFGRKVTAKDLNYDDNISITGHLWVWGFLFLFHENLADYNYTIHIVEDANNTDGDSGGNYYWEESCAYQCDLYRIEVTNSTSTLTTWIHADISNILTSTSANEFIYSFAGDSGDTKVNFIV